MCAKIKFRNDFSEKSLLNIFIWNDNYLGILLYIRHDFDFLEELGKVILLIVVSNQ
jgi:hypothetical protein